MATLTAQANPMGLDGIEFIEFCAPQPQVLDDLFSRLGFTRVGQHKRKNVSLHRQGRINFVINKEPKTFAAQFASEHGPSICATAFRVKDAKAAQALAVNRGAKPIDYSTDQTSHSFPAICGVGDSAVYFIDRYRDGSHYDDDFDFLTQDLNPEGFGNQIIDHLTNNVPQGEMLQWCEFYHKIFDFTEVRHFDIRGKQTGLVSKVMRSPCGKITIPINEPTDPKSQIQEYLNEYRGSGIQHVALLTEDIINTVRKLRSRDIHFLETPNTYYDMLPERVRNIKEDLGVLRELRLLCDGDDDGYLLQIFTQNLVGPIFVEIIQRRNHSGFGEGNFQALFDAIERDQARRGVL